MPLVAMASAMLLIIVSLILQPKLFQLFQPIGGVKARPLVRAKDGSVRIDPSNPARSKRSKRRRSIFPPSEANRRVLKFLREIRFESSNCGSYEIRVQARQNGKQTIGQKDGGKK